MSLTASDRTRLIKMAATMPIGAPERKALLVGLKKTAAYWDHEWNALLSKLKFPGWEWKKTRFSMEEGTWWKKFEIGQMKRGKRRVVYENYGVTMWVRTTAVKPKGQFPQKHSIEVIMGWASPRRSGDEKKYGRREYSMHFSDAVLVNDVSDYQVSDSVIRWIKATFKKVEKEVLELVKEERKNPRYFQASRSKSAASYFDMFFKEKDVPYKVFDVKDSQGVTHMIPNEVVIEAIKKTRGSEKAKIEKTLRMIDFKDGDVNHYLEHLARGLAEQYSGALRFASGGQSMGVEKVKVASDSPVLMPVQGRAKEVMPANGTDFKLREVQKMVGGYVEVVYLRDGRIMLVDEEGLLKQLPINRAASLMAGRPIVGNALVMPDDMFR